jgi:RNA recognition motif-containing protein
MQRVYVSNLPFRADDTDLLDFAVDKGIQAESAQVIIDSATKKSRGFGFITVYGDRDELMKAISRIDGSYMDGRCLKASEARGRTFGHSRRDDAAGGD